MIPNASGAGYDLKTALQPFGTVGVQNEISVVSGLRIPTGPEAAGVDQQPPGGRPPDFHITSLSPLFSGVRQYITNITQECCDENGNPYNNVSYGSYVRGPTSDQLVGAAIGGGRPVLTYRVQKEWYLSQSAPYGRDLMSYRSNGTGGTTAVPATDSPQAAYQALFFSQPTGDQTQAAIADFTLRSRRSVLDLVRNRTAALINKLGSADRQKMQQHFDEIRDLENRLVSPPPDTSCQFADPGPDPVPSGSYGNEEYRADVMGRLLHMAFKCDLTRSASLMYTMAQSHLSAQPATGIASDFHELGHSSVSASCTTQVAAGIAWHMKHFANIVKNFRDTPEGAGTMLDNSAIVFLWEGGHGQDASKPPDGSLSSHSTENMAVLIAGRAGGLNPGRHVVESGKHPGNVIITAMNAVGLVTNSFGDVTGDLPSLRT